MAPAAQPSVRPVTPGPRWRAGGQSRNQRRGQSLSRHRRLKRWWPAACSRPAMQTAAWLRSARHRHHRPRARAQKRGRERKSEMLVRTMLNWPMPSLYIWKHSAYLSIRSLELLAMFKKSPSRACIYSRWTECQQEMVVMWHVLQSEMFQINNEQTFLAL